MKPLDAFDPKPVTLRGAHPPPPTSAGPKWLGALAGRGRITADLTEPAADTEEWEALQS